MFYLMTHSTHFIYGYMASDILLRTILIVRKETHVYTYDVSNQTSFVTHVNNTNDHTVTTDISTSNSTDTY